MFKMEDLTKQSIVELKALYNDLSKEIYEINTEFSITRKLEKPHLLRSKKKDRARVLTAINQQSKSLKAPQGKDKRKTGEGQEKEKA